MTAYDRVVKLLAPHIEHHQQRYARALGEVVREGTRWLDIGSGTALHHGWGDRVPPHELARRAKYVIGCDLVETHLAANPDLTAAAVADGSRLPFADNTFDLVTANMVLEHLPEPEAIFREVRRVLRPGGEFLFVTPNAQHPVIGTVSVLTSQPVRRRLAHWVERNRSLEHIFHTYYRANTSGAVARLAKATELEPVAIEHFYTFPLLARPIVLTWLEALFIAAAGWRPLHRFRSNLLGRLAKPAAPAGAAG